MNVHNFHIPVMGIGFTIDTPIKVAQYGIYSVISLVDDVLIERMREFYCKKMNIPFVAIDKNEEDFRAKRITLYLNLIDKIVKKKFKELKASLFEKGSEIIKYLEMLPGDSKLKHVYNQMLQTKDNESVNKLQNWLKENLSVGSIDVNIMTKLDKTNFKGSEELSVEYNDAHAALRGFALSDLNAAIILSAGLNIRLYSHMANFEDFYPDENGFLKKRIVLKVSDFRSALTQSKFLAKKGLWVSEYRIESGLNCGGHAFPTQGCLLGPILEDFKKNKKELIRSTHELFIKALERKNKPFCDTPLNLKITVQGGIGTAKEHDLLLDYYKADSTGWGSPFLLVPGITNVDQTTLKLLCNAKEEDLYLSDISPLGVPFNSLKGNTKDEEKQMLIEKGSPGSACPKKYLVGNKEFTSRAICTGSRQYQHLKITELKKKSLDQKECKNVFKNIVGKTCLCVGLGASALLVNKLDTKVEGEGVSICPGPNLKEMVDHIYGRINSLNEDNRPNMFIKELDMYLDYLKKMVDESLKPLREKQIKYFKSFQNNLQEGIKYYKNVFFGVMEESKSVKDKLIADLNYLENKLSCIQI
ncbi:MAG: hypothetical protein JRC89_13940 [Deltaproteobacteria bacterium]|nr:hypothetical protein [Deltaproteobacteria bacterium]